MKAIIVDDETIMIKSFLRVSSKIKNLEVLASFENGHSAIEYVSKHKVEIAFLDIEMKEIDGFKTAKLLRTISPSILIVFITAYDGYIRESNDIGADYYILKPYKEKTLSMMMQKMELLIKRQDKHIYIQMFGRFVVYKDKYPIRLVGKAKEILALIVTKCGKEISNEELYSTIWEGRTYDNEHMKVYYNALKRLKLTLQKYEIEDLLISTIRGQIINTEMVECDYYELKKNNANNTHNFEGEFLSEFSWGEYYLEELSNKKRGWE